jgi:deoxyribodipyrimidine photolyase-related protein
VECAQAAEAAYRAGDAPLASVEGFVRQLIGWRDYVWHLYWDPAALTEWFHANFVDGYDWVMVPNVVGMSQHADGGLMATKPYAGGGAYINRMSDYRGECPYRPSVRLGPAR